MSIFSKLLPSSGAVARWNKHFAEISEAIRGEDRIIREHYQKLIDGEADALAKLNADPSVSAANAAISAHQAKLSAEACRESYSRGAGAQIDARIEKKLDINLLESAIAEARSLLVKRRAEALESASAFAEENGADMQASIAAKYDERLRCLDSAENALANERKSTPQQSFTPRGKAFAATFIATALA
jgi:hypothetical protein